MFIQLFEEINENKYKPTIINVNNIDEIQMVADWKYRSDNEEFCKKYNFDLFYINFYVKTGTINGGLTHKTYTIIPKTLPKNEANYIIKNAIECISAGRYFEVFKCKGFYESNSFPNYILEHIDETDMQTHLRKIYKTCHEDCNSDTALFISIAKETLTEEEFKTLIELYTKYKDIICIDHPGLYDYV